MALPRRKLQPFYAGVSRCLENRVKEHNNHFSSADDIHSISNNNPWTTIAHFKILDQDSKQVTREAIHIRINKPDLNCNTGKMYIPEIFKCLLGADRYSNNSDQMVDSDLPKGSSHLTIPTNRFSRAVCLAKSSRLSITTHSSGILPYHQLPSQVSVPSTSKFKFIHRC